MRLNQDAKIITFDDIYILAKDIQQTLLAAGIDSLIYGSFAKYMYGLKVSNCNDLDIIIHQYDLEKIYNLTKDNYKCFKYEFGLHANSRYLLNIKNEPFDISFDSFEHYFLERNLNLDIRNDYNYIKELKCIPFSKINIPFE